MLSEFAYIFSQMAIFCAIMAVGFAANKSGLLGVEIDKHLAKLVLNVSLPAMIMASVLDTSDLPSRTDILLCIALSSAACLMLVALAFVFSAITRTPAGIRGVYRFMVTFGNVGFLGLPIVSAIFGSNAVIYGSICNLPFNVLVFSVGRWFVSSDAHGDDTPADISRPRQSVSPARRLITMLHTLTSPALVACLAATICALVGLKAVPLLGTGLTTLGSLTTPAAMLIVGSSLANIPIKDLFGSPRLFAMAAFRLVIAPALLYIAISPFTENSVLVGVIMVTSAMPVATNGTLFCYEYGGNAKLMSQGTFLTTVLSLVTVPLLVALLG